MSKNIDRFLWFCWQFDRIKKHVEKVIGAKISFKEYDSDLPMLAITKMLEINKYLDFHKPDFDMLNETWLKKAIKKNELFLIDAYKYMSMPLAMITQ